LEDRIGETIRVSLTEDPEFGIPVCKDLVKRYTQPDLNKTPIPAINTIPYNPFEYKRRNSNAIQNIGGHHVPVVIADFSKINDITPQHLRSIGYTYHADTDKWSIGDAAADYIFTGYQLLNFELPGTLQVICHPSAWELS
jgi:(E)-4-hydroxy-3-methylbut-2-enyl-diphosphate synthase